MSFGPWTSSAAQNTNSGSGRSDYSNFEVIAKKNIFNPRRSPSYQPTYTTKLRPRTDYFALVGVMSYGKGPMAFFDGTQSDYHRVLKPNDTIGGFKVTAIEPSSVKLASATNEIEVQVGMQLAREEQGEWKLSVRPESLESAYHDTPMRSASAVNSERANATSNQNPLTGAINAFLSNNGFRGGFPGGFPQTQTAPAPTTTQPTQPSQPTPPGDPNDLLARMAARAAADRGEAPANQQQEPAPGPGGQPAPNQTSPTPNQQAPPVQNPDGQRPPNQQEPPPNP